MAWSELYYHAVTPEIAAKMTALRSAYIELGKHILELVPEGRSKSLAKTQLEESLMRAIQGLALQGEKVEAGKVIC